MVREEKHPPSPRRFCSTPSWSKSTPREFVMIVQRTHGFSGVVARGYHLRVPLQSRNRKSRAPRGKKYAAINENSRQRWHDFCHHDQTRPWRGRAVTPGNKTPNSSPRPILTRHLSNFVSAGLARQTISSTHGPKNVNDFASTVRNCLANCSSPFLLPHRPANRHQRWITLALMCQ